MIINHNMNAMNAHRNMMGNVRSAGKSMEKLSSGLRINRAGDDAAGLAISEKMRAQVRGLDQASRNAQDGISMIQTAEGALNETHSILQRMRELATQASNDTNTTEDRDQIQKEINQLTSEINRVGNTTEFNTQKMLNGGVKKATAADVVAAKAGEYKVAIADATKDFTLDGETIKGAGDLADLVTKLGNNATLKAKYDIVADGTKGITVKQKAGHEDSIQPTSSGTVTVTTAGVKEIKIGDDMPSTEFSATLQIGANKGQAFTMTIEDMRSEALKISLGTGKTGAAGVVFTAKEGVTNGTDSNESESALDVSNHDNATNAIEVLNNAINTVSTERSKLGAYQNRLEHTINNLGTSSENLQAAESRVRDVDMANEMMTFSKNNILQQAAQAMLAQANQQPQGVLQLLR
ncbi:flagellin [Clostridium sp. Marseille-Q2269]|uniref:flagellin N-terminal helical domain-containing protein n=1 Tax=Clostridium sp. Marseille-Q2269 TaxID=2942205 RepID=UPI0020734E43|nr:flagellin [Clostridium sp. Marseille-Q2269]